MSRFYLDNTLFHRLLPLANGEITVLMPGRIPIHIARALECLLLSDELIINPLEPRIINSNTETIISWLGVDRDVGPCFDLKSLDLAGQKQSARLAALETMTLIEEGARSKSLRAVIPSIDTITAYWRDAVPENAGRSDWQPLWRLLGESHRIRHEQAEKWLEAELSGKLLFTCWCSDQSMWDKLCKHAEWLQQCSTEELDVIHLMFFILLNQHLSSKLGATYASTNPRMSLGHDAQHSLYKALCSKIDALRRELRNELGEGIGSSPTATVPAYPIGLIDLAIVESSDKQVGLPINRVSEVLLGEFWVKKELHDLRSVLSRLNRLTLEGAHEQGLKEVLREVRDVEEGVRRRLCLSTKSRRVNIEVSDWRSVLLSLFREPLLPYEFIRQEVTVRSPRVTMLARTVARL